MRFASIGSGSEGNGLVVEAGATRVMIDCGFGARDCATRLARVGLTPDALSAIIVTHEHSDHVGGVPAFAGRHGIPVWLTFGTLSSVGERFAGMDRVYGFDSHDNFAVGDLAILPFPVPHDAREPVQFVVSDGAVRVGVVTDLGMSTPHVQASLSGLDALVLECNHDAELLANGAYPDVLKARVGGDRGHLSNAQAGALLARLGAGKLQHVIAAHLSEKNNRPELARAALSQALGCAPEWVAVARQDAGLDWRSVD